MEEVGLDFGNFMAPGLKGGLDPEFFFGDMSEAFEKAHAFVQGERALGALGFMDLPYASDTVHQVQQVANSFRQSFKDVVILGGGGSALGAKALKEALLGPYWNERSEEERDGFPRLHIIDNPDPLTVNRILERVNPERALFNVVSKSGKTTETMAQYLVARERVESIVGKERAREHFLFTTTLGAGVLHRIGEAEGIPMLSIPEKVGGRFSVFSSVGLFPAAMCGVDVSALCRGAAKMEERCRNGQLSKNLAGIIATLLWHADEEQGRPIHVFMPYSDRLKSTALWFQQLWAESLGKAHQLDGTTQSTGPTPVVALGSSDQHSLLQLLMEGPDDKVVVFLHVQDHGQDVVIPNAHVDMPELAYLGGSSLTELINTGQRATAEALRLVGRPNAVLRLPQIDEITVGQLLVVLQIATIYAGALYRVNPLYQPGVELSKRLTHRLMGHEGAEHLELQSSDPRWTL